jgi:hypothetical protein
MIREQFWRGNALLGGMGRFGTLGQAARLSPSVMAALKEAGPRHSTSATRSCGASVLPSTGTKARLC